MILICGRPVSAAAVLLAGICCGCASGLVNPQVPPGGSDAFREGYVRGCNSGFSDAGRETYETRYVKDQQRYASDADYRSGWDQGHKACYEEEQRAPMMTNTSRF